jgi:hypothetical protein
MLIHVSQATQSILGPDKTGDSPASRSQSRPCTCKHTGLPDEYLQSKLDLSK